MPSTIDRRIGRRHLAISPTRLARAASMRRGRGGRRSWRWSRPRDRGSPWCGPIDDEAIGLSASTRTGRSWWPPPARSGRMPGGQRIQRAGMARLLGVERPAHPADRVGGGQVIGLVEADPARRRRRPSCAGPSQSSSASRQPAQILGDRGSSNRAFMWLATLKVSSWTNFSARGELHVDGNGRQHRRENFQRLRPTSLAWAPPSG